MKSLLYRIAAILVAGFLGASCLSAAELGDLAGKWTLKRKNEDGVNVVQQIHFKDGKFTFRMMSDGGSTLMYAEGTVTVTEAGSVKVLKLSNIKAGDSDTNANPVDEIYEAPFRVSGSTCYLASGLDRERERSPRMDAYRKE